MRSRTLRAEVVAGVVVAVLVTVAVPALYNGIARGTEAVRAGDAAEALRVGGLGLGAAVVAVVALAVYSRWLTVTHRPRGHHNLMPIPSGAARSAAGVVLMGLCFSAWPVLSFTYGNAETAFRDHDFAWAVGYAVASVAWVWLVLFSIKRYVDWAWRRQGGGDPVEAQEPGSSPR